MGLSESICARNVCVKTLKDRPRVRKETSDEDILQDISMGVRRGGGGRRKNRRAVRLLKKATLTLRYERQSKMHMVSQLKNEIGELETSIRKMKEEGIAPDSPILKMLEKKNGESITLKYYLDRNSIVLEEGDTVHRHMMDGDAILFNRQPTLHRMSMMCHIARIMQRGDTFRMNVADRICVGNRGR